MRNWSKTLSLLFIVSSVLSPLLFTVENVNAQTTASWNTQTVDSRGAGGLLIIDSKNNLHIFYHQETIDDIKYQPQSLFYAAWANQKWSCQQLNDVAGNTFIMDKNNKPHIVSIENGSLTDIPLMGSNWNLTQFGVEKVADKTMKLDSSGNLHVLTAEQNYFSENKSHENNLYYHNWTKTGDSYTLLAQTSTTGAYYDYLIPTSIAVDSQNNPQVIFVEETEAGERNSYGGYSFYTTSRNIEYARYNGSEWLFETIATNVTQSLSDVSDLVLDSRGYPHLCYIHYTARAASVEYIYFNSNSWINQTVDGENYCYYSYPTLHLDENGNPQVYYYKENHEIQDKNGLMAAQWAGTHWDTKNLGTVPFNSNEDSHEQTVISSIVFDSQGNPYVIYSEVVGTYGGAARLGDLTCAFLNTTQYIQSLIALLVVVFAITVILFATLLLYRKHRKIPNLKP
jgi:hypothetical protein